MPHGWPIAARGAWERVASGLGANFLRSLLRRGRRLVALCRRHPVSHGGRSLGSTCRRSDVADRRGPRHASPASAIKASSAVATTKVGGSFCEGFRMTAPSRTMPRAPGAVVRKPPRKESAGSGAPGSAGTMGIWLGATGAAGVGGSRARSVEEGQSGR